MTRIALAVRTPVTRARRLAMLAAFAAGGALLYLRDPANGAPFPPCPFHAATGLDCPFCGTGRALHALLHGEVRRAFGFNPLVLGALPLIVVGYFLWRAGRLPVRMSVRTVWIGASVLLAFAVLRNLPIPAFAWMAS